MTTDPVLDARGVVIAPGDTVIYGFGVGRSVAMAEAVVLGTDGEHASWTTGDGKVSLTASGRVRLRVVRRSYGGWHTKPVVDVAPDRLVVLKQYAGADPEASPHLPPSPLPTQDEERAAELARKVEHYRQTIAEIERTGEVPERWRARTPEYVAEHYRKWLAEAEAELAQVEERVADA